MKGYGLFIALFLYRMVITFNIRTFFQPDEYYQSLEPAHALVFGYGYLTWEYVHGIRSIAHPLLFAFPYKIVQILRLDSISVINAIPKVIGSLQAAFGDYFTFLFIRKYWAGVDNWAIIVPVLSPWNAFVAARTFSNSFETALTAYALYKWPFNLTQSLINDDLFYQYLSTTIKALCAIGLSFLARPTTVIIWCLPALTQLWRHRTAFLFEAVFVAYVGLQYSVILDSFYYGSITFPLLNFLKFNTSGSANFYGVSTWHYYLLQGLPLLLTGYLPFAVHGACKAISIRKQLLIMMLSTIVPYSVLGHKEVRFIMPLLPILHGFTAKSMASIQSSGRVLTKMGVYLALVLNICLGIYITQYHQRGVVDLIDYVSKNSRISELTLFMPCHSTPWSASIHRQGNFRFLTCEPPLNMTAQQKDSYRDEADQFYDDPATFLEHDLQEYGVIEYIATFQATQTILESFWTSHGIIFTKEKQWYNSHLHDDPRRSGDVLLYRLKSGAKPVSETIEHLRNPYQAFA